MQKNILGEQIGHFNNVELPVLSRVLSMALTNHSAFFVNKDGRQSSLSEIHASKNFSGVKHFLPNHKKLLFLNKVVPLCLFV